MLMPKRTKFRKAHRNVSHGHATAGHTIVFGDYALMAVADAWLDSRQIESARRAITNYTKRGAKIWIRIFPHKPITAKPAETRMGSGKGAPDHWVAVVKPGTILFEMSGVSEQLAREALRRAGHKMPMDVRVVSRAESTVTVTEDEPAAPVEETA